VTPLVARHFPLLRFRGARGTFTTDIELRENRLKTTYDVVERSKCFNVNNNNSTQVVGFIERREPPRRTWRSMCARTSPPVPPPRSTFSLIRGLARFSSRRVFFPRGLNASLLSSAALEVLLWARFNYVFKLFFLYRPPPTPLCPHPRATSPPRELCNPTICDFFYFNPH